MATDVERLVLELSANFTKMQKSLNAARGEVRRAARGMTGDFGAVDRAINRTAGLLATAFGTRKVIELADSYTRYTNQLKIAGLEGAKLNRVQDDLFAVAQRYGVELESLGTLYSRVALSATELGANEADLERFTTGVAAALKIQGATAAQSRGALLQLSQALGGNIVRAEEFNSIQEGARPILVAVANGSDRFKGSVAALTIAVKSGTVASQEFFEAFLKGSAGLEGQAAKATLTIGQSLQILNNALGRYIGETDAMQSATQRLAQAIQALAKNLDTIIPALGVLVLLLGTRYVGVAASAALASRGLATALTSVGAASAFAGRGLLAAFGGPIGAALFAVTAGVGGLAIALRNSNQPSREVKTLTDQMEKSLQDYSDAAIAAAEATGKEAEALRIARDEKRKVVEDNIRLAKSALIAAAAELRLAEAAAQKFITDPAGDAAAGLGASEGGNYGAGLVTGQRLNRAAANVAEITGKINALKNQLDAIEKAGSGGGGGSGPKIDLTKDGKASGPSPEELARMRERLRLENELAIAEARHDYDRIAALERQLELIKLADDFRQAQVANPEQKAAEQQQALIAARMQGAAKDFATAFRAFRFDKFGEKLEAFIADKEDELSAKNRFAELEKETNDILFAYRQGLEDATYTGINDAMHAVADGNGLEYLKQRITDALFAAFSSEASKALAGTQAASFLSSIGLLPPMPTFAGGVENFRGGWARVHKDENLFLPRGTSVKPAHKSMGGNSNNLNIAISLDGANGDAAIEAAVDRGVERAVRRATGISGATARRAAQLQHQRVG